MPTIAVWMLLLLYPAFSVSSWRVRLSTWNQQLKGGLVGFLLVPYWFAVKGKPSWTDLLALVCYILLPTMLLRWRARRTTHFQWTQLLVVLFLWIPLEPDLFLGLVNLLMGQPWDSGALTFDFLPKLEGSLLGPLAWVPVPITLLIGLNLTLFLFLVEHPLSGVGFTLKLNQYDLTQVLIGFGGLSLIALPIGLKIVFLAYQPRWPGLLTVIEWIVLGYLLVALVEEFLFRGVIQNLLIDLMQSRKFSLLLTAFIFGLSHLNNPTPRFAEPNGGYVLMGTLAGIAYGWVWLRTGKVTAAAITHMLVNLSWRLLLR
jgi:membrane protease YdiL (CAAX protease family)